MSAPKDPGPRLCVAAVVTDPAGRLALVRTPRGWELPGGKVATGERWREALARELCEEIGVDVAIEPGRPEPLDSLPVPGASYHGLVLVARGRAEGELRPAAGDTVFEADWFCRDALPLLSEIETKSVVLAWARGDALRLTSTDIVIDANPADPIGERALTHAAFARLHYAVEHTPVDAVYEMTQEDASAILTAVVVRGLWTPVEGPDTEPPKTPIADALPTPLRPILAALDSVKNRVPESVHIGLSAVILGAARNIQDPALASCQAENECLRAEVERLRRLPPNQWRGDAMTTDNSPDIGVVLCHPNVDPRWLVFIHREGGQRPTTIGVFEEEGSARNFYNHHGSQWSGSYLCRVVLPNNRGEEQAREAGFAIGTVDNHGELELALNIDEAKGSAWLSEEMWRRMGEVAGWAKPLTEERAREVAEEALSGIDWPQGFTDVAAELEDHLADVILSAARGELGAGEPNRAICGDCGQSVETVNDTLPAHNSKRFSPSMQASRRAGAIGHIRAEDAPHAEWWVRHDDGTEAPYAASELTKIG